MGRQIGTAEPVNRLAPKERGLRNRTSEAPGTWYVTRDDQGAFFAIGVNGQHIWINPKTRVVIVKFPSFPVSADVESMMTAVAGMDFVARELGRR